MKCYLYILKSTTSDKFYVGVSQNPERRLLYHNTIEKGFTSRYRPWEIVYEKEYPGKEQAYQAEIKIKSWKSRIMIERLITGNISL